MSFATDFFAAHLRDQLADLDLGIAMEFLKVPEAPGDHPDWMDLAVRWAFLNVAVTLAPDDMKDVVRKVWTGFGTEEDITNIRLIAQDRSLWGNFALTPAVGRWYSADFQEITSRPTNLLETIQFTLEKDAILMDVTSRGVPIIYITGLLPDIRTPYRGNFPEDRAAAWVLTMLQLAIHHHTESQWSNILKMNPILVEVKA